MLISPKAMVVVRWKDAQSSTTKVYKEEDDANYHVPIVMETVGWLLKDDERGISVMNEAFQEDGVNYRGHTFILRSLIMDIITIRKERKPRREESHARAT